MRTAHLYDPVTAIDETAATGETARLFADIRETMRIPIVTSIWRGLAGMEDGLDRVWTATKLMITSVKVVENCRVFTVGS